MINLYPLSINLIFLSKKSDEVDFELTELSAYHINYFKNRINRYFLRRRHPYRLQRTKLHSPED